MLPLCAVLVASPTPDELTTPIPTDLTCMALRALCAGSDEVECVKKLNQRLDEHRLKREIGKYEFHMGSCTMSDETHYILRRLRTNIDSCRLV